MVYYPLRIKINNLNKGINMSQQKKASNAAENCDWNAMINNMMDFNKVTAEMARNMEAMVNANQLMIETVQTMGRKAYQSMQDASERNMSAMRDAMSVKSMDEAHKKSAEMLRHNMKSAAENAAEMVKLTSSAAMEMAELVNKRVAETMKEHSN